jgi:hypothetical protein
MVFALLWQAVITLTRGVFATRAPEPGDGARLFGPTILPGPASIVRHDAADDIPYETPSPYRHSSKACTRL